MRDDLVPRALGGRGVRCNETACCMSPKETARVSGFPTCAAGRRIWAAASA